MSPSILAAAAHTGRPGGKTVDYLLVLAILTLAVFLASTAVTNSDIWQHLATGRLIARGEFKVGDEPFSHSAGDAPWVNPAWLYDLLLYGLYQMAGGSALVIAKAAAVAALAMVLLLIRRPRDGFWFPAMGTGLALLALYGRLPLLQPTVVSYLFLGVLLFLLHRGSRLGGAWKLPAVIGLLCALWVNFDAWFILGPATLFLWLVGRILQTVLPFGDSGAEPPETAAGPGVLAVALAVSFAACLLNPHHVRVLAHMPDDLALTPYQPVLQADPVFRDYFIGPFESDATGRSYTDRVGRPAGIAFHVLLWGGLASFAANFAGWRWGRALVWLAFAALAGWRWRLVPFFAVVAGPILVLNLQAAIAQHFPAAAVDARAEFTRRFLGGFGRALTLLVGVVLLAAAWPGWLGPREGTPRRVAWRVETDESTRRLAVQLSEWYAAGKLRPDRDRMLNLHFDVANYCAWFCPEARVFIDNRLGRHGRVLAEFVRAKALLNELAETPKPNATPPSPASLEALLRAQKITHVILANPVGVAQVFWRDPDRWPFWTAAGRFLAFGWNDPQGGTPDHADLAWNPVRPAFTAAVPFHQPAPPAEEPRPPDLWQAYTTTPPRPPADMHEARAFLSYRLARQERATLAVNLWGYTTTLGLSAPAALAAPVHVREYTMLMSDAIGANRFLERVLPDPGAFYAVPVLAIRTARAAISAEPNDYEAYVVLADAYQAHASSAELQHTQVVAALRQAESRIKVAAAWGRDVDQAALDVHASLQRLFAAVGQLDLALDQLNELIRLMQRQPASPIREERLKELRANQEKLDDFVRKGRDDYEVRAAGRSVAERVGIALSRGLTGEAISVMERETGELKSFDVFQLVRLLLNTGQIEKARTLVQGTAAPEFWQVSAVAGDYRQALSQLGTLIENLSRTRAAMAHRSSAQLMQSYLFPEVQLLHPFARLATLPFWAARLQEQRDLQLQLIYLRMQFGLLAVEAGETAAARDQFAAALKEAGPRLFFDGRPLVERYLILLRQ